MKHITDMLQQQKSLDGVTLFEHLATVFHQIQNNPTKISENLDSFEIISDFVKKNSFKYQQPNQDSYVNNIPIKEAEHEEWINKCHQLLKETKQNIKVMPIFYQDFLKDSRMLEWAGYSFGEQQNYRISISIQQLAQFTKAREIRFWGKILCRENDYFIAEGITGNQFADILPAGCEQQGEGINTYTYWVTHNVLDEWVELPLVTPEQIRVARKIKYMFTGDLNRNIKAYPPFPGKQKHLLRAQLARISSATVLVPQGVYQTNDEQEKPREIILEEIEGVFKLPEYGDLKNLDTWVHQHPHLLTLGRTTHWVDPTLNEEQKEAASAELTEKDPENERLKGISDEQLPVVQNSEGGQEEPLNWTVREVGDLLTYNKEDQANNYGTIVLRNMTWPGAVCLSSTNGWCNIYVGYGLKFNQLPFHPVQPDDLQDQGEDFDEFPEPNPAKAPYTLEPDSDDENQQNEEDGADA